MSKYLLSQDRGQVGPGIRSLNIKGKDTRDIRQTGTYECWVDVRTKNYLNTVGTRRRQTLTKRGQVVSVLALLACSLGFCWEGCTHSRPFACNCVGVVCVFGRCELRVVAVVTLSVKSSRVSSLTALWWSMNMMTFCATAGSWQATRKVVKDLWPLSWSCFPRYVSLNTGYYMTSKQIENAADAVTIEKIKQVAHNLWDKNVSGISLWPFTSESSHFTDYCGCSWTHWGSPWLQPLHANMSLMVY